MCLIFCVCYGCGVVGNKFFCRYVFIDYLLMVVIFCDCVIISDWVYKDVSNLVIVIW